MKDVRRSERLTDSAVCLVADDGDMDIHLQRLLKQHGQLGVDASAKRVLELNPSHPLIRRLAEKAGQEGAADAGRCSLSVDGSARIVEGEPHSTRWRLPAAWPALSSAPTIGA